VETASWSEECGKSTRTGGCSILLDGTQESKIGVRIRDIEKQGELSPKRNPENCASRLRSKRNSRVDAPGASHIPCRISTKSIPPFRPASPLANRNRHKTAKDLTFRPPLIFCGLSLSLSLSFRCGMDTLLFGCNLRLIAAVLA
jgi:hypothetical protein